VPTKAPRTFTARVELFGVARLTAGRASLNVTLPPGATLADVARALAHACPALVGKALLPDGAPVERPGLNRGVPHRSAGLAEGYVFNINGLSFARDLSTKVAPGDSVLLLSSESGG
jgi:molybdopterin converting factor small subunit